MYADVLDLQKEKRVQKTRIPSYIKVCMCVCVRHSLAGHMKIHGCKDFGSRKNLKKLNRTSPTNFLTLSSIVVQNY